MSENAVILIFILGALNYDFASSHMKLAHTCITHATSKRTGWHLCVRAASLDPSLSMHTLKEPVRTQDLGTYRMNEQRPAGIRAASQVIASRMHTCMEVDEGSDQKQTLAPLDTSAWALRGIFCANAISTNISCVGPY